MNLSMKQKAILTSLYQRYKDTGRRDTFVTTKGITTSTMKSFYKTGFIETDKAIKGVPSNMRITDAGIKVMEEYFEKRKKNVNKILVRNKQYIRFIQNTEEKRLELQHFIEGYPIILIKDVEVVHRGYGIFEVIIGKEEPIYYGVYSKEEAIAIDIGGFVTIGTKPWYVEKVRIV